MRDYYTTENIVVYGKARIPLPTTRKTRVNIFL